MWGRDSVGLYGHQERPLGLPGLEKNGGRGKLFRFGPRPPVGLTGLETLAFRYQKKGRWGWVAVAVCYQKTGIPLVKILFKKGGGGRCRFGLWPQT